jgi:hypothetical protein
MPNQPSGKFTPADRRLLKKVATGPLLGAIAGKPIPTPAKAPQAKAAPLGHFGRVKATLDQLREANG